ncbi:hypothetical protein [Sulfobacillus thermosulfidooxidans]|uniref:hypothetical protein n=1 Tax=Sulfobacillus thermosulfidooxidans TaxID=28034 RepID=UPI00040D29A6|nr:hypothetical protein [Sulfobacillus thermosulfidooxidans]OLZ09308.1 hypothetical protein BFX05_14145 [Sulfobacillus thermosulfidooxidans]OLZ14143.1 hypothetical protein BFX06_07545 [Sulfobacillus thermosulfidooxidans]OLZ18886.1 hypothetical protein BFX07_03940 [Sulfobacillus thermosulfidooxidans]
MGFVKVFSAAALLTVLPVQVANAQASSKLPSFSTIQHLNSDVKDYKKLSMWIPGMGIHEGRLAPSLVLMINNHHQVVGMEQTFPSTLPYHSWMDPKTTEYNAGRAFYSQHLMFVPPSQITPTMSANVPSDLTSFDQFKKVNGSHVIPYFQIKKFQPGVGSIWGPDGPALRIILSRHEKVVGGIMAVPAKYGWNPWYDQKAGHPVHDPILGNVYTQTVYFVPRSQIR